MYHVIMSQRISKVGVADFVTAISTEYAERSYIQARLPFARLVAERYGISPPGLILLVTDPELGKLTLSTRLARLGIKEEQYLILRQQPGYRRLEKEWKEALTSNAELQALTSTSHAMEEGQWNYDSKTGEATSRNFDMEQSVLNRKAALEKPAAQNNVQVNFGSAWDRARQLTQEAVPTPVVEVVTGE